MSTDGRNPSYRYNTDDILNRAALRKGRRVLMYSIKFKNAAFNRIKAVAFLYAEIVKCM